MSDAWFCVVGASDAICPGALLLEDTTHSSNLRREINKRHVVLTIASSVYCASKGKHAILNPACAKFWPAARIKSAQCWLRLTSLGQRMASTRKLNTAGSKTMPSSASDHSQGCGNKAQLSNKSDSKAGELKLRRRLSKIFQRDKLESGLCSLFPFGPGTPGNIQSAICQSPRIQRFCRPTSA